MDTPKQEHKQLASATSVSATILGEFFDELAKEESLADVASMLRKVVLEDGVFAEPAIRAALLQDPP